MGPDAADVAYCAKHVPVSGIYNVSPDTSKRHFCPQYANSRFLCTTVSRTTAFFSRFASVFFLTPQLSREQTGFVEGVWQERRRLEAELSARREEVERLRAREDVTRAAAKALESRAEELSATLRQGQAQVKHDAQAAAAASTRDAMEALRRQLDELRREVDRTKQEQAANSSRPSAGGAGTGAAAAGAGSSGAASGLAPGVGGEVRSEGWGAATAAVVSSAVLEGEFQRLRAKYEKAKGRIAALEELVAVSRRVSTQTRKEFQVRAGKPENAIPRVSAEIRRAFQMLWRAGGGGRSRQVVV